MVDWSTLGRLTGAMVKTKDLFARGMGPSAALVFFCVMGAGDVPAATRPNIVLIVADDMGFSDLGCYGSEIKTPNIDRLAAGGLRFSQFYSCSVCGISRASMLTGLYHHQVDIHSWNGTRNDRGVTIDEVLHENGYHTMMAGNMLMVGKWANPEVADHRSLDRYFGLQGNGPNSYFDGVRCAWWFLDDEPYEIPSKGYYNTDQLTDFAVQFIDEAVEKEQPFFLYLAYMAPHWPLHAKPADIAKYRKLYSDAGWDAIRKQRHEQLLQLGLIDPAWRLPPRDQRIGPWEDETNKSWQAERMAVYAAQIDCLDQNVGRVLEALRTAEVERNTLILFLSDNGAASQGDDRGGPTSQGLDRSVRGGSWRRDDHPMRAGNDPSIMPGPHDTFATYGPAWANVSTTPFRGYKQATHEGGIAVPLIVHWPTTVTPGGAITHEVSHVMDIMATCLDATGIAYPRQWNDKPILPLEGKSLLPVLKGKTREGHKTLFWQYAGRRAVRADSWKLVSERDQPWELYDMQKDRTEMDDLANQESARVQEMSGMYNDWAGRVGISP